MTRIPCILFEDDHLLAVNKPAGIATHRAAEDAPWGIVEFLRNQRPDLPNPGIHQRLDRETSGVMVFARSPEANRSLAVQFEKRHVRKSYLFATKSEIPKKTFTAAEAVDGKLAGTRFRFLRKLRSGMALWEAVPETGRTHQVRVHAATHGLPIAGDTLPRHFPSEPLLLHAARLEIIHPTKGHPMVLEAAVPSYFETGDDDHRQFEAALALRRSLLDTEETNAFRWIHREADGFPALTVDRLGNWLYVEDYSGKGVLFMKKLHDIILEIISPEKVSGVILSSAAQGARRENKRLIHGETPPPDFTILENGIRYYLDPLAPGGTGLFLDQRENRRRIQRLSAGKRILNLFAYTCGFSVSAAKGNAAQTVNVDLSRRALETGRRNFQVNGLDPERHLFMREDFQTALHQLARKRQPFDMVLLDPPSSSRSRSSGHFSIKQDLDKLVRAAIPMVAEGGWLFCSTNLAGWKSAAFKATVEKGVSVGGRKIVEQVWMPQPFDFPASTACPAHLKTVWLRLD